MPRVSTELLKEELLRLVTFPVLGIFQLLNFWQNLSTVAYKAVAYKKNRVISVSDFQGTKCTKLLPYKKPQQTQNISTHLYWYEVISS